MASGDRLSSGQRIWASLCLKVTAAAPPESHKFKGHNSFLGVEFYKARNAFITDGRKLCYKSEIKTNAFSSNIFPKVPCSG